MPCITEGTARVRRAHVDAAVDGPTRSRARFHVHRGQPAGAVKEYLDWILSDEGQCIILEKGYAPAREVKCK